ncbi:hypothetical protein TVAG_436620 [Trichomonas vaginalis G3]|uniref:Uncharacterized protein n=1 Tax=Trichomonas vaginalis (strain ATCC PRA-98 / G3) TaxID=412133 RepID=A2DFB0_TRIV3|nr:protein of unknown function family [Trichomonas vaginalis G3]EAY20838.1 hypothetical protein TVAG_436620 [Trichomonas vaginalis G3]KAI5521554.1 protein of unknown function family [Trichomonas vaginalis G3]|eukprot:XP_001581824.1 hypothetical protein [Trichomonas vaginalis G3]
MNNVVIQDQIHKALGISTTPSADFMNDENYVDDEICVLDIKNLRPQNGNLHVSEAFDESLQEIKPDNFSRMAKNFYSANKDFLVKLLTELFWLIQVTLYPGDPAQLEKYQKSVGKLWTNFIFPLETHNKDRDFFFDSFPYFATQTIQRLYINLSHANPETTNGTFRLKLCSTIVRLFTSMTPLESQLGNNLTRYFSKPPEAYIEDTDSNREPEILDTKESTDADDIITDVKLPVEDLKTLTKMQRRKRPISKQINMAGVSSLISAATNHRSVPFEHDAQIVIQYPKNELDWTINLPPLLPPPRPPLPTGVNDRARRTREYNPMAEPRSYLHRSLRPNICDSITEMKNSFETESNFRLEHQQKLELDLKEMKNRLMSADKATKDKFISDLRALQMARKRNETPEIPEEKVKVNVNQNQQQPVSVVTSARNEKEQMNDDVDKAEKEEAKNGAKAALDSLRAAHDEALPMFDLMMRPAFKHHPAESHVGGGFIEGVIRPIMEERREKRDQDEKIKAAHAAARQLDPELNSTLDQKRTSKMGLKKVSQ